MVCDESEGGGKAVGLCRRWAPCGISVVLALAAVLWLGGRFSAESRGLWNGVVHDRNTHAQTALRLARAVERGDVADAASTILKCKVWPPVHGILAAGSWLAGARDWRALVWPGLLGWGLAVAGAGMLAARLAGPGPGWLAALFSAGLVAQSPAHRAFATDVMLESLGAGLTVAVLWLFTRAVQAEKPSGWWRATALGLTLLFFEKYNYWLIVAAALGFAWLSFHFRWAFSRLAAVPWRALVRREVRQPLTWLAVLTGVGVAWILTGGPKAVEIAGHRISLYPPNNLLTVAYALLFARVAGGVLSARWQPRNDAARALWQFHVLPVAVSFLFPQRLGAFLGFLSPGNFGDAPVHPFPGNLMFYLRHFVADYHAGAWLAAGAAVLALVAWWQRRGEMGMRAVMVCFLLGGALTLLHPNQKSRFLHSWMPALWISAGVGAACVCSLLPRRVAPLGQAAAAGILLTVCAPAWLARGHSPETGNRGETAGLLDLSDGWLEHLPATERVAFLATQSCRGWAEWTYLQRFGDRKNFVWMELPATTPPPDLAGALTAKTCDWLVTVQVAPDATAFTRAGDLPWVRAALEAWNPKPREWLRVWQSREQGITATVWRRPPAGAREKNMPAQSRAFPGASFFASQRPVFPALNAARESCSQNHSRRGDRALVAFFRGPHLFGDELGAGVPRPRLGCPSGGKHRAEKPLRARLGGRREPGGGLFSQNRGGVRF
jgi:hypothetical protein